MIIKILKDSCFLVIPGSFHKIHPNVQTVYCIFPFTSSFDAVSTDKIWKKVYVTEGVLGECVDD